MTKTAELSNLLERAAQLLGDPERQYDLAELLKDGEIFRIHDYESMGDRSVGTYDCGSVRLKDTPKSLYRAMFLFAPERASFKRMYKGTLLTLVSPNCDLVASLEFYKYELAVYFSASKEHIEGRGSGIICGLPGSDNGVRFKGQIAKAWFGLIKDSLEREWMVYGGNDFAV